MKTMKICMDTCLGLYGIVSIGMETMGVWKSSFGLESLDTWFRTLYLVYGLGLGTPKCISCRVELRRVLSLLDMCFGKGLVAS